MNAATPATVATITQPRYRPTVPSSTSFSNVVSGWVALRIAKATMSTTSRAAIMTTERPSRSNWTQRIHAAFSSREASIQYPIRRCRGRAAWVGSACQMA